MPRQILTNFNLFVDGKGYAGKVKELELAKLKPKTLEYLAGGMGATVQVPLGMVEDMETSFTLMAYDLDSLRHFGLVCGEAVGLSARGAVCVEGGDTQTVLVAMRGHLTEFDPGTWKPGDEVNIKVTLSLTYYRIDQGGSTLMEIDVENMVAIIDGRDQLAATRAALGI
jgi:uncharacterized protein